MKYLLDTNIWLEALLNQERSEEVIKFLNKYSGESLAISDFSLHSIIIILTKLKEFETADLFLDDIIDSGVKVVSIDSHNLKEVLIVMKEYNMDFDDAYRYFIAKNYNLVLVSFDKDFDKTDMLRKTPVELMQE
ncbi:MAG TPA: type II toxin-antitoxin system VapC family toxin [Persephonella sp.]|uniref:PIN n=1 Tax=Persephonella marina (strain DSM 14350 / EX-H1) TaxID=123214 RepID=C0QSW3_PERMH|nr:MULTISPECIES: PIN domain-containing protein [Persephonella]ACO04021.1 PIN [Persephonella marina EX-H1]HCB70602.1 type II toxin-antitoxin system VapC family toxin [Persephonella sp.]